MSYTFSGEEYDIFSKPIFDALIKNNAPEDLIKKVFFDLKIPQYFEFLPNSLKENKLFLKECLEKEIIPVGSFQPEDFNKDTIPRDLYLKNIDMFFYEADKQLYNQDEEIIITAIKSDASNFYNVEKKFKDDKDFVFKLIQINPGILSGVNENIKEEFINNESLVLKTLKEKNELFHYLKEDQKYNDDFLKIVLTSDKGYRICKDFLNRSKDDEVALMALEVEDQARKKLNQKYTSIFKQNKVSTNCHQFLKIYLTQKSLEKNISEKSDETSRRPKV